MKKLSLAILSLASIALGIFGLSTPVQAASVPSLASCYAKLGEKLPSRMERAIIAAQNGIFFYKGTVAQNNALSQLLCPKGGKLGFSVVTGYKQTLAQPVSPTQNYFPVSSLNLPDGTQVNMNLLGQEVFVDVEPGGTKEEISVCTGVNTSSLQFTGCTRGLAFSGSSLSPITANQYQHNAGSSIIISNVHYVYNNFVNTFDSSTLAGLITFNQIPLIPTSTPTNPQQAISLYQFQQATTTGGINSSETTRGVSQLATGAQAATATSLGSTGARLVIPSSLASSTSSGSYTAVITSSTGKIDSSFGGVSSSLATTNANNLVVQLPANASTSPVSGYVPLYDSNLELNVSSTPATSTNAISQSYALSITSGNIKSVSTTLVGVSNNTDTKTTVPGMIFGTMIGNVNGASCSVIISIGATTSTYTTIVNDSIGGISGQNNSCTGSALVPANWFYKVNATAGSGGSSIEIFIPFTTY